MPDFVLECSEILGLSQTCQFWGETINYRNVLNYTARARFRDREDSTYALWSGISGLIPYVTGDYFTVTINGVDMGSGKITSFSSDGERDVSRKFYDVGFQILNTGDLSFLYDLDSHFPTGDSTEFYAWLPYLNSFSETLEYSQDHNSTVGFNRSLDFDFERGFLDRTVGAEGIKNQLLDSLTDFGLLSPVQPTHYFEGEGIKVNTSRIDNINGKYSYSETYDYQALLPYTWDYTHSFSYGDNGVTTTNENGTIKATKRISGESKIAYANSGWAAVQTGIFSRVTGFFNRWSGETNSACSLTNDPIEKSVTRNIYDGSIQYGYGYSNDMENYSGYFWSYENQISRDQEGWNEVSENGTLRGKKYETGILNELISYHSGIVSGITGRVLSIYASSTGFMKNAVCTTGNTGVLVEVSNETSYTSRAPEISYSYNFTDDPSYYNTGVFRKVKSTYSDTLPVHIANFYNIINSEELAQGTQQSTLGSLKTAVEIVGDTGVSIAQYLARATGEARIPTGVTFITDEQYSFDPFSRTFNWSRDYAYSRYRSLTDYQV